MASHEIRKTQALSRILLAAPGPKASIAMILLFSAIFWAASGRSMGFVLLAFALPALISPNISGARMQSRRAYPISFLALALAGLSMHLLPGHSAFASALAIAFAFSLFTAMAITGKGPIQSLAPASAQSVLMLAGAFLSDRIWAGTGLSAQGAQATLLQAGFFSAAMLLPAYCALLIIEAPLRRMNVRLLELSSMIIANQDTGSKALERAYQASAEKTKLPISLVSIKANGKTKALILSSFIHPGPFGNLCSSDMPGMLTRTISERTGALAFFTKGAGTNDTNLSSSSQMPKLADAYQSILQGLEYTGKTTEFRRTGEAPSVLAFAFKDTAVAISTFSPGTTEDVESEVGFSVLEKMKEHAKTAIFIEAHNCLKGPAMPVDAGSKAADALIKNAAAAAKLLSKERTHALKAGAAKAHPGISAADGMGSEGTGLVLFEANSSRYALLFTDSNNLAGGLREELIKSLKEKGVKDAEVISSDTHTVNTITSGENPLCANNGRDVLLSSLDTLYQEALADLEHSEIAAGQALFEAEVFGQGRSKEWFSAVRAVHARAMLMAPLAAAIAIMISRAGAGWLP